MRRRTALAAALALAGAVTAARAQTDDGIAAYLAERGQAPIEYALARAAAHRVTIIGEAHWLRQDAELVAGLVPRLREAAIDLAAEIFPASEQARIDRLLAAPEWNEREATAVLRAADWPYKEYRDILHAAWSANRKAPRPIAIRALGPPRDWREALLSRGLTYDSFMADLVAKHIDASRRPIVVYCGLHHAFTRYYQAELDLKGRAMAFMDRMGNILSRRFGEQVFLIALHKPIWCGDPEKPTYCLPFGGRLDCAADKAGRPVGFDVVGSPLADLRFEPGDYYGLGHPGLRFADYTDGYIWTGPLGSFRPATIIPLAEYAPDAEALAQVAKANPFTDEADVGPAKLAEIWAREIEESRDILGKRGWTHLAGWRSRCAAASDIVSLNRLFALRETIRDIHPAFEKLYPVAVAKEGTLRIFVPDEAAKSYVLSKTVPEPFPIPTGIRAAFPLEALGGAPACVVTEEVFAQADGLVFVFHEFVHCAQWTTVEPRLKDKLGLYHKALEKKDYMWELQHPFPYEEAGFVAAYGAMLAALEAKDDEAVRRARADLARLLSADDRDYMNWQEWKEGLARHLENAIRVRLSLPLNKGGLKLPFTRVTFYAAGDRLIEWLSRADPEIPRDLERTFEAIRSIR